MRDALLRCRFWAGLASGQRRSLGEFDMASKRKAISPKTRFEIFKRDGFTCQYCGSTPPKVLLEVDHIVAVARGGSNDTDNLTTSCETCNRGKGARALESVPQSLSDKAADVAERERQLRGYHSIMESRRNRLEEETWLIVNVLAGKQMKKFDRGALISIKRFLEKLPFHVVLDAAEIAKAKCGCWSESRLFRYFCGICWKKLAEQEHGAIAQH